MFRDNMKMAWDNIINNKMRSFLTMLGIIIGVASIIALITIVKGATDSITSEISSFGANKVTVMINGTAMKPGILRSDIKKFDQIENIKGVSPTISDRTNAVYRNEVYENVMVEGKNEVYFNNTDDIIKRGRSINILDIESENRVCLIGADIEEEFFYGINPIGETIRIGGISYTVVGSLKAPTVFQMNSNSNSIIVPYTTAMSYFGTRYIKGLEIFVEDGSLSKITTKKIEQKLNSIFNDKDNSFTVFNMQNMLDSIETMTGMMSMLLGGIAAISLLVGGIGIMNMMLVSVTERTTEIGLRKALGAEPKQIQQQFLIESVVLSVIGGIIGLILGALLAFAVSKGLNNPFNLSLSTIILAFGFSSGVGVVFGIAPARKASKLNPIDALRSV